MMDIVKPRSAMRTSRGAPAAIAGAALVAAAFFALPQLLHPAPALPTIERSAIVVDTARYAPIVHAVSASGTLVSNRTYVVSANADGIIANVDVRPGSRVSAGSPIAELQNPDLDAAVTDARAQVAVALAELSSAREEAGAVHLDGESAYRSAVADEQRANEEASTDTELERQGLIPRLQFREALIKAGESQSLTHIAARKNVVDSADSTAKIAIAQAAVDRARAALAADLAHVATLDVSAGGDGIVQSVMAERGQRVPAGTELASIADERDLKAVLLVAEGDMTGIGPGLPVSLTIDGSGHVRGHVERVAPSTVNGSVAVDVALEATPSTLRPAQDVDGTIELSRIPRALTIARPAGAADGGIATLFRLVPGTDRAERVRTHLGTGTLERIAVLSGLRAGDAVIVTDTTAYADDDALRIAGN